MVAENGAFFQAVKHVDKEVSLRDYQEIFRPRGDAISRRLRVALRSFTSSFTSKLHSPCPFTL